MSDFLNKEVDAYGRQDGKRHQALFQGDHSLSGVYFQNRNTSNMNQNTAARAKTIKEEKVKDTFDDKLELGKFHSVSLKNTHECH